MKHWIIILLSFAFVLSASAKTKQEEYDENAAWARQQEASLRTKSDYNVSITELCTDASCVSQVNNPSQSNLSDSEIQSKANVAYANDDTAQAVQENFNKGRPNVKTDPAYEFALIGQENAYEITHGISNKYVDCDSGTQCVIDHIPKTCNSPTNNNVPCTKTPVASVVTSHVIYSCPAGWTRQGSNCSRTIHECRWDSRNGVLKSGGSSNCASNSITYTWNGVRVFPSQGYSMGEYKSGTSWGACKGSNYTHSYEICGPSTQTIRANLSCSSGFTLSGGNCIKNVFTWKTECTLISECKLINEQCIEGPGTRIINGIPTTLSCWKYQMNHLCDLPDSCASLPTDCETTSSTCSLLQKGVCIENEVKKTCPKQTCSATNLICGDTSFCLDGDCYNSISTQNTEFNKSASALAGVNAAAKDLGDPPLIFSGKNMQCTDAAFGFADCCADGGWGTSSGLASCNEEEEALGKAKEKKLTIYIGDYCAEKILGACIRKKKSYCVYDNKMARIIQQQGAIAQLGTSLGAPDNAHCDPITPEQLQKINFDLIDFSDFYDDMYNNMTLPDTSEIKARVSSALED